MSDTDDVNIPDSWDEGEETTEENNPQASTEESQTEESQTEESQSEDAESEESLPELVSDEADTSGDSGYVFLNTPPSAEDEDTGTEEKDRRVRPWWLRV